MALRRRYGRSLTHIWMIGCLASSRLSRRSFCFNVQPHAQGSPWSSGWSPSTGSCLAQRRDLHQPPTAFVGSSTVRCAATAVASPGGVGQFADGQDVGELFDVLLPPGGAESKETVRLGLVDAASLQYAGVAKKRGEVHRDGDWHRSIHIWVLWKKNEASGLELLVQQRAATKDTHPNFWDVSVAGHLTAGDRSLPTALREAEEELGLTVAAEDLELLFSVAVASEGETARHGRFIDREVQDVYLMHVRDQGDSFIDSLRYSTGEVAALRSEAVDALLSKLRARDAAYVPRDAAYVSALAAALESRQ
eukprot:TRINITY_DN9146_c0_g1_i1.p1 TRINITY_DN9146_c0_g1~~TRINITY_DN9146_c0_g1_i1.p1  ORF type:complete len:330 (-),score=52.52 TRINITY_DN9146_c0_g1_i1:175-1095(-)